jgi:hypothetical protein
MFGSYRALLARPGARRLTALCAISWLSYCGYALAMVLVVHAQTGSFGQAGTCAAGVSLGTGFLAPARGHWVQSRGASAMRGLCSVHAASGALLLIGVGRFGVDVGLPAAIFLGASSPPLIAVARSRWTEVVRRDLRCRAARRAGTRRRCLGSDRPPRRLRDPHYRRLLSRHRVQHPPASHSHPPTGGHERPPQPLPGTGVQSRTANPDDQLRRDELLDQRPGAGGDIRRGATRSR